jgi:ectoine hydroxylase-related dioxygenase (phytanoyl-CoA dioxygenase family)
VRSADAARSRVVIATSAFAALDRDGYVVVDRLLETAWVRRLSRAFEAAPPQANGTQHVRVTATTPEYDAWLALTRHPDILALAAHVVSTPLHVRDIHGRNPLPGYGQQGLHGDSPLPAATPHASVATAIVMLDDFTSCNGATRVVPGTHVERRAIRKELSQPIARHPRERLVTGRAGTVLLLNGHVWHSGTRNTSGAARRAVQMVMAHGPQARVPNDGDPGGDTNLPPQIAPPAHSEMGYKRPVQKLLRGACGHRPFVHAP